MRDSLFYTKSGFIDFRGFKNLALLCLFITCFRLVIENLNNYGVLVDLMGLVAGVYEGGTVNPNLVILLSTNAFVIVAFATEKLAAAYGRPLPKKEGSTATWAGLFKVVHWVNIGASIVIPCIAVWMRKSPSPGSFVALSQAIIVWMKLISYVTVNQHFRVEVSAREDDDVTSIHGNVKYPANLTLSDVFYFIFAPTLCYELNFPRTARIRWRFVIRRAAEVVLLSVLILSLVQQWVSPAVGNTIKGLDPSASVTAKLTHTVTRTIKLALPNNLVWLMFFYTYFHSFLNVTAELLRFGDRQFYRDWWNANTIQYFWKNWNIPVHKWLFRHVYRPLRAKGVPKLWAVLAVFFLSAVLHEVAISVPLGMIRGYAFAGMIVYVSVVTRLRLRFRLLACAHTYAYNASTFAYSFCVGPSPFCVVCVRLFLFSSLLVRFVCILSLSSLSPFLFFLSVSLSSCARTHSLLALSLSSLSLSRSPFSSRVCARSLSSVRTLCG